MIPHIKAIFATDLEGGMGYKGSMPWPRLKGDLANFRFLTQGTVVIMGRSTWDSDMPTPLVMRQNVVITHRPLENHDYYSGTVTVSGTVEEMISFLRNYDRHLSPFWWVIGGAQVLEQWLPYCSQIYYTRIHGVWQCDTHFPQSKWQENFRLSSSINHKENEVSYDLEIWNR